MDWYGKLLSNRGMPRFLLEIHLQFLYEELIKTNPDKTKQYSKLIKSAEELKKKRQFYISQERSDFHASNFNNKMESQLLAHIIEQGKSYYQLL